MAKFKIVGKSNSKQAAAAAKPAASGSARTGAKVQKTKSGKAPAGPNAEAAKGVRIGITTGLSVSKYQNKTILDNAKAKKTDAQIAAMWRAEFPNAKADYTEETVRGVRGLVNRGKHGNPDQVPSRPVPEFDESGDALPFRGEKAAAKRAAAEEEEEDEAPAPKKGKTVIKKKSGKK